MTLSDQVARFRAEYGAQRAAEGRGESGAVLLTLPYVSDGPLARQWSVRARTFDAFVSRVLMPVVAERTGPISLLDLGAGNGWLCYRLAVGGHRAVAVDVRDDSIDGLGAAAYYVDQTRGGFDRVVASFDALPLRRGSFDIAVFNAAIHYALDLGVVLREAFRAVRSGGRVVILDSPFYQREEDGEAMVAEKTAGAAEQFGERAEALMALPFVEYLTSGRLLEASDGLGVMWRCHRVRYPLWYEARPLVARLRRRRAPSRFDLWECVVP